MGQKLLVVDDEENLRSILVAALNHYGFETVEAPDGNTALNMVDEEQPDLIVLDVMMPGIDGFKVCEQLRARGNKTPIIFLTAKDDVASTVSGLNLGADDYLQKPFNLDELVARINSIVRRSSSTTSRSKFSIGDLSLDDTTHSVIKSGQAITLSPTEYRLLKYLFENQGRVVSKSQLMWNVWDFDFEGDRNVVETYISYLRKKVDNGDPKLIQTVRGFGYSLRMPE